MDLSSFMINDKQGAKPFAPFNNIFIGKSKKIIKL